VAFFEGLWNGWILKRLFLFVVLGIIGWQVYAKYLRHEPTTEGIDSQSFLSGPTVSSADEMDASAPQFTCDGRIYCSQMTSCAEAEYFLENCPGVKMDGGGDGVPCERQWCGNR
jgi:hypothetical protein